MPSLDLFYTTSSFTLDPGYSGYAINASSNSVVVTVPDANDVEGEIWYIFRRDLSSNTVQLLPSVSGQLINGLNELWLTNKSMILLTAGQNAEWYTIFTSPLTPYTSAPLCSPAANSRFSSSFVDDFVSATSLSGILNTAGQTFGDNLWIIIQQAGTGTISQVSPPDSLSQGLIELDTGTTEISSLVFAKSGPMLILGTGATSGTLISEIRLNSNVTSFPGTITFRIGYSDSTGATTDPNNGIYFRANQDSTNWVAVSRVSGVETSVFTGISLSTSFQRFKIMFTYPSGTPTVNFFISPSPGDDVQVAQITTNIPTSVAIGPFGMFARPSGGGNADVNIQIDYWSHLFEFTTPR